MQVDMPPNTIVSSSYYVAVPFSLSITDGRMDDFSPPHLARITAHRTTYPRAGMIAVANNTNNGDMSLAEDVSSDALAIYKQLRCIIETRYPSFDVIQSVLGKIRALSR
jgi:hypothetical protein